jgi:hypothetical protein
MLINTLHGSGNSTTVYLVSLVKAIIVFLKFIFCEICVRYLQDNTWENIPDCHHCMFA